MENQFKIGDIVKFKQGPQKDLFRVVAVRLSSVEAVNIFKEISVVLDKAKIQLDAG